MNGAGATTGPATRGHTLPANPPVNLTGQNAVRVEGLGGVPRKLGRAWTAFRVWGLGFGLLGLGLTPKRCWNVWYVAVAGVVVVVVVVVRGYGCVRGGGVWCCCGGRPPPFGCGGADGTGEEEGGPPYL